MTTALQTSHSVASKYDCLSFHYGLAEQSHPLLFSNLLFIIGVVGFMFSKKNMFFSTPSGVNSDRNRCLVFALCIMGACFFALFFLKLPLCGFFFCSNEFFFGYDSGWPLSTLISSGSVQASEGVSCTETSGFDHAVRVTELLYNPGEDTTSSIEKVADFKSVLAVRLNKLYMHNGNAVRLKSSGNVVLWQSVNSDFYRRFVKNFAVLCRPSDLTAAEAVDCISLFDDVCGTKVPHSPLFTKFGEFPLVSSNSPPVMRLKESIDAWEPSLPHESQYGPIVDQGEVESIEIAVQRGVQCIFEGTCAFSTQEQGITPDVW
jgi:hypothetical protein